jgi:hypothetical protein
MNKLRFRQVETTEKNLFENAGAEGGGEEMRVQGGRRATGCRT